ncbi:MAG: acyl-CoA dehydratase activase [Catenisphaera adipataccumulans]|jgi:predicted CoA-substrate-specific enzyme activase|uniref:acyl-CoA dehydratase activase n=1 Tax=Catenisphaera adipataccumulans TaxID=700500 RepID=UPI003D9259A7
MIYYTCKYAPVEMMAGFGQTCERLDPNPANFECVDSCAHQNLCGFAKAVIEEIHQKKIKELIITDCCDSMRRINDVLKNSGWLDFLYFLPLPHTGGEKFFAKELENLCEAYSEYSGIPFDLDKALAAFQPPQKEPSGPYIRFTGAHGGHMLKKRVEATFPGIPIVDDTCTGNRAMERVADADNFFEDYAEILLHQKACMRMWNVRNRTMLHPPIGTIYHTIKFCDYYGFEYMNMKEDTKMPLLKIETDTTPQSSGQIKTRLDAFAETVTNNVEDLHVNIDRDHFLVAGIDSGSTSTDVIIMNEKQDILASTIVPTGAGATRTARQALDLALNSAHKTIDDIDLVVTTGYGRENIAANTMSITEITCHAKGAHYLDPKAKTVIDIGGQDSKVIRIDEDGRVENFVMNDKCAAGTGRFLDMQARALEISLKEMSALGLEWKKDVTISSMCTVFAESEVVSLVAENVATPDIIHGLNKAVASKTATLVTRVKGEPEYIMTGGVAQNKGVVTCLEEKLGAKIFISSQAQSCGAIGAALLGIEAIQR